MCGKPYRSINTTQMQNSCRYAGDRCGSDVSCALTNIQNLQKGFQIGPDWMTLSANDETTESVSQSQRGLKESIWNPVSVKRK